MTRKLIWTLISGNPYIKNEDKPKSEKEIMKLSIDDNDKKIKVKSEKITPEDIKIFQHLQYNKQ